MGGVTLSDKENVEKENEQFSSSILYVATGVYVGICAMVFGALYAKLPTFGEAFLVLMKDYGTILAGIPVLVAVVVAKQQLDANRRQHVATVKRSFMNELKALEIILGFTSSIEALLAKDIRGSNQKGQVFIWLMDQDEIDFIKSHAQSSLASNCIHCHTRAVKYIEAFNSRAKDENTLQNLLHLLVSNSILIERRAKDRLKELSQYWS